MSLKYLINLFAYKIYKEKILPHSDIRKMIYGMTVLSNELIKIIILIIFFKLIGHLPLFLFSFCILMSIRTYSGGLHFENSIACFFFSLVFFLLSVVILPKFFLLNFYHGLIIGLSGVLILSLNSPRPSALRPIINKKKKENLQITIRPFIYNLSSNSTDSHQKPNILHLRNMDHIPAGNAIIFRKGGKRMKKPCFLLNLFYSHSHLSS